MSNGGDGAMAAKLLPPTRRASSKISYARSSHSDIILPEPERPETPPSVQVPPPIPRTKPARKSIISRERKTEWAGKSIDAYNSHDEFCSSFGGFYGGGAARMFGLYPIMAAGAVAGTTRTLVHGGPWRKHVSKSVDRNLDTVAAAGSMVGYATTYAATSMIPIAQVAGAMGRRYFDKHDLPRPTMRPVLPGPMHQWVEERGHEKYFAKWADGKYTDRFVFTPDLCWKKQGIRAERTAKRHSTSL